MSARRTAQAPRGFVLVATLVLMTGLLLLAAATLRLAVPAERMAGIDLDRALAFQLAEATLRDAQQDILGLDATGQPCGGTTGCRPAAEYPTQDGGLTDLPFVGTCRQGMCYLGPGSVPPTAPPLANNPLGSAYLATGFVNPWDRPDPGAADPARPYGQFGEFTKANWTALQTSTGAAQRPRYWVELVPYGVDNERLIYRITVRATGRNAATVVMLQEIYQPT